MEGVLVRSRFVNWFQRLFDMKFDETMVSVFPIVNVLHERFNFTV